MRIIGLDVHRSFAVAVFLDGGEMRQGGRVELTRDAVIAFGRQLRRDDDVVIEATVNTASIVRLLAPFVQRVVITNPLQVRAIAHAKIKTDKTTRGCWRSCAPAASCPKSGCQMRPQKRFGAWWRSAPRSFSK